MLSVRNVSYALRGKSILTEIDLEFEPGKLHLILGPNGAGKSSLLKLVSGQVQPTQGEILYSGVPLSSFATNELARKRAVLSQHVELPFSLKVEEVVMMGRYPHFTGRPHKRDYAICEDMMAFFDLSSLVQRDYTTLSGGEKQRVQFARVMSQLDIFSAPKERKYLILDEPLTFLDIFYQLHLMNKIRSFLQEDLVFVGVIHDIQLALQFADRVVLLNQGKVLGHGSSMEMINENSLETLFKVKARVIQHAHFPIQLIFE